MKKGKPRDPAMKTVNDANNMAEAYVGEGAPSERRHTAHYLDDDPENESSLDDGDDRITPLDKLFR